MGLRELITKNYMVKCHTREEQLSVTGNGFVFSGAKWLVVMVVLLLWVCQAAMSSGSWIHIKLY